MSLSSLPSLLLLIFGFGFVIFWHELGHFLAAKWVGIKVEQFAVGFGQALFAWRKGIGFRVGSTQKEYEEKLKAYVREREGLGQTHEFGEAASEADKMYLASRKAGFGETEYRLNWIPLGGYVKMLGQDDLNPNRQSEDPRAYNKKSIGARMIVVSAGVIMNIILAAIGFMIVFMIGFRVQPAVVGAVAPNSPAARATLASTGAPAPLQVGDRILYFDDKYQHDFTKVTLNVALSGEGKVPMLVRRVDGREEHVFVTPESQEGRGRFLEIGVERPVELRGIEPADAEGLKEEVGPDSIWPKDMLLVQPEDTVTAINGEPVKVEEYYKLDRAIQNSNGGPVRLTVRRAKGTVDDVTLLPHFASPFGGESLSFAGMIPRTTIELIMPKSPARGKLLVGDVVLQISYANGADPLANPTAADLIDRLNKAGKNDQTVEMKVLRDGREVVVTGLTPNVKVAEDRYGLHVALSYDDRHAVVAGVQDKTAAAAAGISNGTQITAINGQPVQSWFDVKRLIADAKSNAPLKVTAQTPTGEKTFDLALNNETIASIGGYKLSHSLQLHDRVEPRKAPNPLVAASWGATETRDFVLQFYLTLHRMFQGRVSYKNMMGPVGIFNAGRHFAIKGNDWLIWFLSMISANLAVVNFLPIPIVDGGLFLFLIIEKIQGRPLSPKTQSIAQVVGLAIIVGVFLLVTYNDVTHNLMR
ncbi:MAG TPA: site-2 protease family protein [Tepidisphaeraceae bacterium]|jgi:regulator of sigma E protease